MTSLTSFTFKALRRNGTVETGVISAATRQAVVEQLAGRGAFAVDVSEQDQPSARTARVSADELALGLRALATILEAGIPIGRALHVLDNLVPNGWRAALPGLRDSVAQGGRFAEALAQSGLPLPLHVLGIIRAGESGGGLAPAVESAAQLLESRAATRATLRSALAYPIMLVVAGTAALALLVGVVLPRFATLLVETGQSLPLTTHVVLSVGQAARLAIVPAPLAVAVAVVIWRGWIDRPDGLLRWHRWLLATPVIGSIRRSFGTGHASASLAALLGAGVPLAAALPHAALASGDQALAERLLAARERIGRGATISAALECEQALTPTVARLVRVGEETGRLADMFAHAARVETTHAQQQLGRLVRVVEPALILAFGAVVMLVAAGLLQAMYGLRPTP